MNTQQTQAAASNPNAATPAVNGGASDVAALKARIAELELAAAMNAEGVSFAVSEKRTHVVIKGLTKGWPISITPAAWSKLKEYAEQVDDFIASNRFVR